jgi:hypothetical protein
MKARLYRTALTVSMVAVLLEGLEVELGLRPLPRSRSTPTHSIGGMETMKVLNGRKW